VNIDNTDINILKNDLDLIFNIVDKIERFNIIGGEPFFYIDICDYLDYLGNKYGNNIDTVKIASNGYYIPSNTVLEIIAKYSNFVVSISNYDKSDIEYYSLHHQELIDKLKHFNIPYIINTNMWTNMNDINNVLTIASFKDLRNHFIRCSNECKNNTIRNGILYPCTIALASKELGFFNMDNSEFLDICCISKNDKKAVTNFLSYYYNFANINKGYCNFCSKCLGFDPKYYNTVIPGKQLKLT
jgi:hypothetical protein